MRLAALLCLFSLSAFAGSWSGTLVDSRCYKGEENNVNPTDTLTHVDRDFNWELRYCAPSAKTRSFTFVDHDGTSFRLDADGNSKAADLVRETGEKALFAVNVTGAQDQKILKVESISAAR